MANQTPAQKAQKDLDAINEAKAKAQADLDATNEAKATAKSELDTANEAKAKADVELAEIDEQIDEANTTLDEANDAVDELSVSEKAKLEKEANQPSADKYEAKAKAFNTKGKNGKPLIGKGTGYEITLNK